MCGRFALDATGEEVAEHYQLSEVPFIVPRYNIAPTQPVAAVRLNRAGARELTFFQWGLIPSWAKDPSIGSRLINARCETAADKPSFRAAFKRRRCLLPATGFFEWRKTNGHKQPMYIRKTDVREADGGIMSLAGLWEIWQSPDGGELETCTILTTAPNALMAPIHDRMPVILDPLDYDMWLDDDTPIDQLQHLMRPFDAEQLLAYPVSTAVNKPQNDTADVIAPVG